MSPFLGLASRLKGFDSLRTLACSPELRLAALHPTLGTPKYAGLSPAHAAPGRSSERVELRGQEVGSARMPAEQQDGVCSCDPRAGVGPPVPMRRDFA